MADADANGPVTALLGPTNTGKTHRAIERMLDHRTGMIGLPLRLLAREVYDRVSARVGEGTVALVTGEEKRVPARPRYWVCTVESMPVDRPVDFLAVDEIQLAAHRQRGHVFTDRLLRARGRVETWVLGAWTIAPLLRELLPDARIDSRPRFSELRHVGESKLSSLPPRTAVVAFTAERVYELAERLRRRRGGAAVVLGALSPRTRNAQVAMYQAGEVDYLVATDAIGMGLNMDVDHVAFAGLDKFDGREHRPLERDELAQIAGRAGRFQRDGTFGTIEEVGPLPPPVAAAIERHSFAPLPRLVWRSADLDFRSIDALIASLRQGARGRGSSGSSARTTTTP
ncbi:MAG: helicase-related protein [Nannocystaceae bacterium]